LISTSSSIVFGRAIDCSLILTIKARRKAEGRRRQKAEEGRRQKVKIPLVPLPPCSPASLSAPLLI